MIRQRNQWAKVVLLVWMSLCPLLIAGDPSPADVDLSAFCFPGSVPSVTPTGWISRKPHPISGFPDAFLETRAFPSLGGVNMYTTFEGSPALNDKATLELFNRDGSVQTGNVRHWRREPYPQIFEITGALWSESLQLPAHSALPFSVGFRNEEVELVSQLMSEGMSFEDAIRQTPTGQALGASGRTLNSACDNDRTLSTEWSRPVNHTVTPVLVGTSLDNSGTGSGGRGSRVIHDCGPAPAGTAPVARRGLNRSTLGDGGSNTRRRRR